MVDSELTYLLPAAFSGNVNSSFLDTTTCNARIQSKLSAVANASSISYDQEFLDLPGPHPTASQPTPFATEMDI